MGRDGNTIVISMMFICAGSIAIVSLFVGCCVSNTISWEVGFSIFVELLGHPHKMNKQMILIEDTKLKVHLFWMHNLSAVILSVAFLQLH